MTAKLSCMVSTAVAAVLFIASLRYVTDFWLLAFVTSFQLHIAIVCILLSCLIFWLTRDVVTAVLLVWALALAIHAVAMLMEFSTAATAAPGAKPFRLLSFNVLMDNAANAELPTRFSKQAQMRSTFSKRRHCNRFCRVCSKPIRTGSVAMRVRPAAIWSSCQKDHCWKAVFIASAICAGTGLRLRMSISTARS